ncbi:histidine kinase [Mucilaginibacter sp. PAMC 26640]|nr:histidine kinase [Mucilaginibacter sp. PAMC 26640]
MSRYEADLTNCDKEPIRIPGKVQSHGFLIGVSDETGNITHVSDNISQFIPTTPADLLGKSLAALASALELDMLSSEFFFDQLLKEKGEKQLLELLNPHIIKLAGEPFNIVVSEFKNGYLLEFEPASKHEFDLQKTLGAAISKMLAGEGLVTLLNNAAREIKRVINYDRVMVYRFAEDGHGQVIAEEKNNDLEPFLHLHYPASDIPKQARQLYKINLTRLIADVNSVPSDIMALADTDEPLDLTHSDLRAVSPLHIQYLKNMGVGASFSISLIVKGELWGLIACHSLTPRFINYNARSAAKLIGEVLSSALEYRQGEEDVEKFKQLADSSAGVVKAIESGEDIIGALTTGEKTLKDINNSSGAALIFEDQVFCMGDTPNEAQIRDLAEWLIKNMQDAVYTSHNLSEAYKPATEYSDKASGILACLLSRELKEMVIWFKPEKLTAIKWAGNPDKPVELAANGSMELTPRKSFETWAQDVKYTSERWNRAEIAAAINIKEHIIYAVKRKANEIRVLNEKLILAYEELDTFSYTVSHDLRTPLSSIKSYSELLLSSNSSLDANALNILERIRKCTDKMAVLITEILNYSRVGRVEVTNVEIDMATMIRDIKTEIIDGLKPENLELSIGQTPALLGDKVMINQVFSNLINNAVKYSRNAKPSKVTINGYTVDNEVIYAVSDNGIGIDVNYYNRVFELFKRLDNAQDIEGTGVGLAIVKRIIERHNGRIWFESKLNLGTTFYMALKNN